MIALETTNRLKFDPTFSVARGTDKQILRGRADLVVDDEMHRLPSADAVARPFAGCGERRDYL
jgi:hypothetical protein